MYGLEKVFFQRKTAVKGQIRWKCGSACAIFASIIPLMNFTVKLPSTQERDQLVEAYARSVASGSDYTLLKKTMAALVASGCSFHAISCLLLKLSTMKLVRGRLAAFGNRTHVSIAFALPISLN
jgi:uncharacterized membrane protein